MNFCLSIYSVFQETGGGICVICKFVPSFTKLVVTINFIVVVFQQKECHRGTSEIHTVQLSETFTSAQLVNVLIDKGNSICHLFNCTYYMKLKFTVNADC